MIEGKVFQAWYQATGLKPRGRIIDVLKPATKKSLVLRLELDGHPRQIIAKRCGVNRGGVNTYARERWIYEMVLRPMNIAAPRLIASLDEPVDETGWLFLEDAGERSLDWQNADHRKMVSAWLGKMHSSTASMPDRCPLPDRTAADYLAIGVQARATLDDIAGRPNTFRDVSGHVRMLVRGLDTLLERWHQIAPLTGALPAALTHGDIKPNNVGVQQDGEVWRVLPFDWEHSSVGSPAVDLAGGPNPGESLDLDEYARAIGATDGESRKGIELAAGAGKVIRLIMAMSWATEFFLVGGTRPLKWQFDKRLDAANAWVSRCAS